MNNYLTLSYLAALLIVSCGAEEANTEESGQSAAVDSINDPYEKKDPYAGLTDTFPPRVEITKLPQRVLLGNKISGSYSQHHEAISQTYRSAGIRMDSGEPIIAIYPDDPDLVTEESLTWYLAFDSSVITQGNATSLVSITQKATSAAIVETISPDTPGDGKKLLAWIDLNGYVQTAPTMIEFNFNPEASPQSQNARIVIPVQERKYFEELQ